MIKAIIFDVGGVIYTGKQRANQYMQEKLKIDKNRWENFAVPVWEKLLIGKMTENEGMNEMANKLTIDKSKLVNTWVSAFKIRFELNKNLLKIISLLKNKYKTAILSDQWIIPYRQLITPHVISVFDITVFSHEVGFRKPHQDIYKIAIEKLGVLPQECIFIDDREENLLPAKKLGMKTILFKNNRQLIKELKTHKVNF